MIVDLHTHVGEYPEHIDESFAADARAAWGADLRLGRTLDEHYDDTRRTDRVVVLGFCAPFAGWVVPNDYVAGYVERDRERLLGFGSVDPNDAGAPDELERMKHDLGLRGCKLAPIYQDADPLGPGFLRVCETLERLELPMLIHQGTTFLRRGPLLYARPALLDEIARRFPRLVIVIAHLGHPWVEEAVVVIRKHPNVYADVSALHPRPWQLYQALLCAVEYRAERKLLFGSDYPFFTAEETIAGLRAVNDVVAGTAMPRIPHETIDELVHRPTLDLLGLA